MKKLLVVLGVLLFAGSSYANFTPSHPAHPLNPMNVASRNALMASSARREKEKREAREKEATKQINYMKYRIGKNRGTAFDTYIYECSNKSITTETLGSCSKKLGICIKYDGGNSCFARY